MKRLFSLFAAVLLLALCIAPLTVTAALAEGEAVTITATETEASDKIDYEGLQLRQPVITDENGNITTKYSTGLSCGSGVMMYVNHYYDIHFAYVNTKDKTESSVLPEIEIRDCDPQMQSKYVSVENGSVILKSSPEPYSLNIVLLQNGEELGAISISVVKFKVDFTDILMLGIGIYALVTAITASGALFRNDFIKDGREDDFKKYVRIAAAVVGLCLIGVALVSIFGCTVDWLRIVKYTLFGVAVIALIASLVITSRLTDKDKRAKAQATARTGGPTNSAAAFEFDENEPTIDDVLNKLKNESKDDQ